MKFHSIKRRKSSRADFARKRFGMSILVTRKLNAGLESFRTEIALILSFRAVCIEMVIVNALALEPFAASFKAADVRPFI